VTRVLALGGLSTFALAVLIGRLWYLQVVQGQQHLNSAHANQRTQVRISPPRGIIEDRNGVPLITNTSRIDVFVTPGEQNDWIEKEVRRRKKAVRRRRWSQAESDALYEAARRVLFERLAGVLQLPVGPMLKEFEKNRLGSSDPACVQKGISQAQLAQVAERLADLPGFIPMVVPVRQYPKGWLGAQMLGYIDQISADQLKAERKANDEALRKGAAPESLVRHRPGDLIGSYGLEKYYDRLLSGTEGSIDYIVNAQQEKLGIAEERPAVPGARLTLTFDWRLQDLAEKLMQGKKGAIIAIDPRDGAVLAMYSYPSFDPTVYQRRPIPQAVMDRDVTPGQENRALGQYPPGSTYKIITAAAGLGEKKVSPVSSFFCAHEYQNLGCHGTHGSVALRGALAASCDVYFYHVGQRLGEEKQKAWAKHFGLGQKTGIDLPKDSIGKLSSSTQKKMSFEGMADQAEEAGNTTRAEKLRREAPLGMNLGEVMQTAIGQGFTATSPLHMALVVGAAANGGKIYRPHLLKKATSSDGKATVLDIPEAKPTVAHTPPVPKEHWSAIREGLRAVVAYGTAHKTANSPYCTISGKTGTAEKNKLGDNYAWFVGYGSKSAGEAPSIAVAVVLEPYVRGLHGGDHAAPLARKLIEGHFGIGLETSKPGQPTTVARRD
jgi:penicillin-binding protein 2